LEESAYENNVTLNIGKYEEVLEMIDMTIIKRDLVSRREILTINKLEVMLWYLDFSNIYRCLEYLSQIL
jgi:hypothetical protein